STGEARPVSMRAIHDELRLAVRTLGRMRGTTALAVVTLALGIAAATTTFSAVYAALFRPIPFADPGRVLFLHTTRHTARDGMVLMRWSPAKPDAVRQQARSFEAVATYTRAFVGISTRSLESAGRADGPVSAEQIDSEVVSSGYFDVLKVSPAIGRV